MVNCLDAYFKRFIEITNKLMFYRIGESNMKGRGEKTKTCKNIEKVSIRCSLRNHVMHVIQLRLLMVHVDITKIRNNT